MLEQNTIPDILTRSADLIAACGLNHGHYWPDADWWRYRRGAPCDVVGAIAVTAGVTTLVHVEEQIVPPPDAYEGDPAAAVAACHPAVRALIHHLRLADVEALFTWSDQRTTAEVVVALHTCAANLRDQGVEVSGGVA